MKISEKKQLTEQEQFMQQLAQLLDGVLNSEAGEDGVKTGFGLLVFTPGVIGGSHVNWVSNCERPMMRDAMVEVLDRWKAGEAIAATVKRNLQ